ncbi:MAG: response regulator [Polyangiaceae bacterium]|jgi:DNA-binding NarL/FixJ family response regulator
MGERIRVAICDDHPVFRSGIVGLLRDEGDLEITFEAGSVGELRGMLATNEIDVLLLDLELPDEHGLDVIPTIADRFRVLVLSAFDEPRQVRRALEGGAVGFVRKDAPPRVILKAIRDASAGNTVLAADLAVRLAGAMRSSSDERDFRKRVQSLTARQRDVLALLAEGRSNREIGKALFVSEGTVKNHVTQILHLLEMPDRTRLAVLLARYGGGAP